MGALTINKVCGSGLKAVMLAAQGIATGDVDIVVAGGMESMSNAPYLLPKAREGMRLGHGELIDSMIHDGLWDAYDDQHMGCCGEIVAEKHARHPRRSRTPTRWRAIARRSRPSKAGKFKDEILPVAHPAEEGRSRRCSHRTSRPARTRRWRRSAKLKAAFKEGGTVTAGNAPGVNDGAAALVVTSAETARALGLKPMARIVAQATVRPRAEAGDDDAGARGAEDLREDGLDARTTVDLFELNEAFAVQGVAVMRELGLDPAKVNVNGGAVALGHPIGASGARVLTTLLYALRDRGKKRGIATLCLGGGNGVALAVEMI